MADIPMRNRALSQLSSAVAVGMTLFGLTLAIIGIVSCLPGRAGVVTGVVLIVAGLSQMAIGQLIHQLVLLAIKAEANVNRVHNESLGMVEAVGRLEPLLLTIADNSALSDAARSITHREKETEALRHAIREEMYRSNWEAAFYLVSQLEKDFGYAREAEVLRKEMAEVREMTIDQKLGEAVSHINKLMDDHHWDKARQELERLVKVFPQHDQVQKLPGMISRRRTQRKQELLKEWEEAVSREEIDRGIKILTELDQFLAKDEANALQESARHVFKARLVNIAVQFGLAVSEQRWRDALEIGLRLRQEFPNSRMAKDIGEKLDILRVRAGFSEAPEVIQKPQDKA